MSGLLTLERADPGADVLVVTNMWPDDERPAYGVFVQRQVDSLRECGLRCDVLYVRGYRSSVAYAKAAALFARWTLSRRGRYRLVHVHAGETTLAARLFLGVPMVASYCGDDVLGDPGEDGRPTRGSLVRAWIVRQVARTMSATITKSREMHEALPAGVRRTNRVIPNGVDDVFRPLERDAARARFGFAPDEVVALFAATKPDIPRKRRWLAEAACERAADLLRRPVRLHVARDLPPADMPVLMNAADVLLHTSTLEGSPNAVKEAVMCRLPVVATPSGDIEEILDGVEPSLVTSPDAHALAEAIRCCVGRRSNGPDVQPRLRAGEAARRVLLLYKDVAPALPALAGADGQAGG